MDITTTSFATQEAWSALASFFIVLFLLVTLTIVVALLLTEKSPSTNKLRVVILSLTAPAVAFVGVSLFVYVMGIPGQRVSEGQANIEGRAEFEHGITELSPLDDPIEACVKNSDRGAKQYAWTAEDGESVLGLVTKSAETDGECVYTFTATSGGN